MSEALTYLGRVLKENEVVKVRFTAAVNRHTHSERHLRAAQVAMRSIVCTKTAAQWLETFQREMAEAYPPSAKAIRDFEDSRKLRAQACAMVVKEMEGILKVHGDNALHAYIVTDVETVRVVFEEAIRFKRHHRDPLYVEVEWALEALNRGAKLPFF